MASMRLGGIRIYMRIAVTFVPNKKPRIFTAYPRTPREGPDDHTLSPSLNTTHQGAKSKTGGSLPWSYLDQCIAKHEDRAQ